MEIFGSEMPKRTALDIIMHALQAVRALLHLRNIETFVGEVQAHACIRVTPRFLRYLSHGKVFWFAHRICICFLHRMANGAFTPLLTKKTTEIYHYSTLFW